MPDKPIQLVGGRLTEVEAKQVSAGAADAGKIPALDGSGKLDVSMMPTGVTPEVTMLVASEALSAGDYVNVWNDAGTPKARKADASAAGKEADGFVLAAVANGAQAAVYHEGANTGHSALTPGARYYLSASTPGAATTVAPTGANQIVQFLGRAVSATKIVFEADEGIVRAP